MTAITNKFKYILEAKSNFIVYVYVFLSVDE